MNNWDLYNLVNYHINKEQTGNAFNSSEFEMVLNQKSDLRLRQLLGLPEQYQLELPVTTFGYGKTTNINDAIKPFITHDKVLNLSLGKVNIPSDYYYFISAYYDLIISNSCYDTTVEQVLIEPCSLSEFNSRKSGWYASPDLNYPILTITDSIYVLPKGIKKINFSYVRKPKNAVITTTINQYGEEEYNALNSVELEWDDSEKYILAGMILLSAGINLRETDIIQSAQLLKQGGE